jgi:DNA-binding transcriptional ArsR family regulator
VQELQKALTLEQPIVSQQLAVLRNQGIVTTQKEGLSVRYTLRDPLARWSGAHLSRVEPPELCRERRERGGRLIRQTRRIRVDRHSIHGFDYGGFARRAGRHVRDGPHKKSVGS